MNDFFGILFSMIVAFNTSSTAVHVSDVAIPTKEEKVIEKQIEESSTTSQDITQEEYDARKFTLPSKEVLEAAIAKQDAADKVTKLAMETKFYNYLYPDKSVKSYTNNLTEEQINLGNATDYRYTSKYYIGKHGSTITDEEKRHMQNLSIAYERNNKVAYLFFNRDTLEYKMCLMATDMTSSQLGESAGLSKDRYFAVPVMYNFKITHELKIYQVVGIISGGNEFSGKISIDDSMVLVDKPIKDIYYTTYLSIDLYSEPNNIDWSEYEGQ